MILTRIIGFFDKREDAIAGAVFASIGAYLCANALLGPVQSAAREEGAAFLWAGLPLFALVGAGLYRFHLHWALERAGSRIHWLIGVPRLFVMFFPFGCLLIATGMSLPLVLVVGEVLRRIRQHQTGIDVPRATAPPPLLLRIAILPLVFIIAPIAWLESVSLGKPLANAPNESPSAYFWPMVIWSPLVLLGAFALARSTSASDLIPGQLVFWSLAITYVLGDYLVTALALWSAKKAALASLPVGAPELHGKV